MQRLLAAVRPLVRSVLEQRPAQILDRSALLQPSFIPVRTFKYKDVLTKRCRDCYYVKEPDSRWAVYCKTHQRHKQRQIIDYQKKWIFTHVTEDTVYKSDDTVVTDEDDQRENYPVEFLNSLSPSGMPPHPLCNGTRLIVTNLLPNVIAAKVITGSAAGDDVFIPRIDLCPSEIKLPFRLKRRQFPIKLAFAMTINKSQGQSLKKVGIYLPQPVFGHGQLYVAFSRVKEKTGVKVQVINTPSQGRLLPDSDKVFTKNIVYKNIL
ncbi:hypothetical protein LAZ67_5000145 [Cordylochernes scorpioides]|uniref:39S ribosomal protein L36, mitochondrial n=1 Tax=Cordylochernes scorpioides TaxID=51811 RepID=A0ABY6KFR8_9ARAC|nr:hypothetical protein LAZ67_5000145 [Cordylochernes scorpioides]